MPTAGDWLAETKLSPPRPRQDVIPRDVLVGVLREALFTHRLALLSAPAGYGKTTLLAAIPQLYPQVPFAWLTLDAEDNDPARFLLGVVVALHRLNPVCGIDLESFTANPADLLGAPDRRAQAIRITAALVNNVIQTLPEPFVLVLDDLHFVTEPVIHHALDYLLEHLPPQMHLAVATRTDPPLHLARLRARRQLFELRMAELRFTPAESAIFLNQTLRLGLSANDLAALQDRSEGWAAGLVLLTSALTRLASRAERTEYINTVLLSDQFTFEFLADEVLSHQAPALRQFLLETSILTELTPPLCAAVTGRENARAILKDLYRRNLFISLIDDPRADRDRPAYRYHTLFAEFLRAQLNQERPDRVVELHLKAAQAEALPSRVIGHYLAAQAWELAAETIERLGDQVIAQGLLDTLLSWIAALPEPVYRHHPRLIYLHGMCVLQKGSLEDVQHILDQALDEYRQRDDQENQATIFCALASLAFTQADFKRCEWLVQQAMQYPSRPPTQVNLLMLRASLALFLKSDWPAAKENLEVALKLVREDSSNEALLIVTLYLGQEFTVLPGGLELLESFCLEMRARYRDHISPIRLGVEDVLAFIYLRRGDLDQAIAVGQSALAVKEQLGGYLFLGINAACVVAMAYAARRAYTQAEHYIQIMLEQVGQIALNQIIVSNGLFPFGRLCWLAGRFDEARRIYERMVAAENDRELPFVKVLRLLLRGMQEISTLQYDRAEQTLTDAVKLEQRELITSVYGSARILLAHLYFLWKRPQTALKILSDVLVQCQRDNTPGIILQEGPIVTPLLQLAMTRNVQADYAQRLLELLGEPIAPAAAPAHSTKDPLTQRELEVLRLIAAGAGNRVIAEKLVISLPTVKSHIAHIMNKLDAPSRTAVVARARALTIIE